MLLHCTYCSAKKKNDPSLLPAIERYSSRRIQYRYEKAKETNVAFAILSGKLGLLLPSTEIPYYDYLLLTKDIKEHGKIVAKQLKDMHVTNLYYFTASVKADPRIKPYMECIRYACEYNGITLEIMEENYCD